MNKVDQPADKRPLKRLFFRHYLMICGLLLGTIFVSLLAADLLMNRVFDTSPDFTKIHSADLYDPAAGSIRRELLEEYGGWIELVNPSGEIVLTQGVKGDNIDSYSREELYAKLDVLRNEESVYYHAYPVKGPQGEPYVLLWKIPEPWWDISLALGIFGVLFVAFLFVALYYYTRFSVRQVKKPIQQIVEGIREMERLNYNKRLEFSAEQEFAEIREAFNAMAQRLQRTSAERDTAETNKRNMLLHLSHDLKTPVTSVFGYSKLLMDNRELEQGQQEKYIRYIHDKSSYMAKLIQDLFELAKLDDPRLKLKKEKVNLPVWFQALVAEFYPDMEARGFVLEAQIEETPLFVLLDQVHMNRVVTNLIGNAMKYNPPGTVLYVSCRRKGDRAEVCIGDSGAGLQEDVRDRLFDEFIRPAGPGKDGTGLGLAICQKIIALHEGTIELEAHADYATLFRISLPCGNFDNGRLQV
ncbi:HAMP domain-containing sensor histidine kinase [Paenibacillus caseinilyticus]|uniref:histidine kinase n=1 Tax=Paenibacillus mucilaginosus K02 TaxID=997761 RepID=I0BH79_9BACL|nr:HAMP domain-containing sensor histidine kinase [Paenibacillus mucilaginosus]AFH61726.1 sensor histidine kinase [Paenibacillus mucilaginosus K02]